MLGIFQEVLGFEKQSGDFIWRRDRGQLGAKRKRYIPNRKFAQSLRARSLPVSFGIPAQDMGVEAESGLCFPGVQDKMDEKKMGVSPNTRVLTSSGNLLPYIFLWNILVGTTPSSWGQPVWMRP